jgi:hypothetical protein
MPNADWHRSMGLTADADAAADVLTAADARFSKLHISILVWYGLDPRQ